MEALASGYPGYLGIESARGADGLGITISYWSDLDAAESWKLNFEHQGVQELGRTRWYDEYSVRVAIVEKEYGFTRRPPS
jgi:heme-degrading monooxygenase HmoA